MSVVSAEWKYCNYSYCASSPNSLLSDITPRAYNGLQREYLHQRNWQMLQLSFSLRCRLGINQHTILLGDQR